jgi:uncharacterized heparinase superfamily protein
VQVYGRVWFRYRQPRPDLRPAPEQSTQHNPWQIPAHRLPSMTGARSFVFLNEPGNLDEFGWDGPQKDKLWRYNQHYFDDLNAVDAPDRAEWHSALVEEWLASNPPGQGSGWEPYPLSLRLVNWIKWSLSGATLSSAALHSLAVQARWLTRRLEIHLLGNHLFTNAKALVFAGLYFQGREADAWLGKGLQLLASEVPEQILPDGGHFERSTLYHALALEDMLDLLNITTTFASRLNPAQQAQASSWKQQAGSMLQCLHSLCHPDGEIGLFNDAAFDIACSPAELTAYAQRILPTLPSPPEQAIQVLNESGYVRLTHGRAVALLDTAPIGPDYLPGHAHADTLTFELSLGLQRVLVNSGTSCYGTSEERLRQRGTAAHNTVVIDGQNSSEVWSGFRVARRAYPINLATEYNADARQSRLRCSHTGYSWLAGKPVHQRLWRMDEDSLLVEDQVEGAFEVAEARYHFHPDLQIQAEANALAGKALLPDGTVMTWRVVHGEARLEPGTWHPRFGVSLPNQCLIITLRAGKSQLHLNWSTA